MVGVRVGVRVLVTVGVKVGVRVIVAEGVKEAMTKPVEVGAMVEEAFNPGSTGCVSTGLEAPPTGVQVGGKARGTQEGVTVGNSIPATVGMIVGGGNGLIIVLLSVRINPYRPHRPQVARIVRMESIFQMAGFTAYHPFSEMRPGRTESGKEFSVSIYYFHALSRICGRQQKTYAML